MSFATALLILGPKKMKVTFKDVGQGDSIILEWVKEGIPKVGIIDCRKSGKKNPVLDFIKGSDYPEIEFVILSHPHTDHYSGFVQLFKYCENNGKTIKSFYHTVDKIGSKYFKYFEINTKDNTRLRKLFRTADRLHKAGQMEIKYMVEGYRIDLFENCYLHCLAPFHDEIVRCQEIMKYDPITYTKAQSAAANLLSTVFKLRIGNHYYLLTSDAERVAFQNILQRRKDLLEGKQLLLCQVPHHGSFNNHEAAFWEIVDNKAANPAVVSSGEHGTYHHPHLDTLLAFDKQGYSVYSTTMLYGMEEFAKIRKKAMMLDGVSVKEEEFDSAGDKVFEYKNLVS